VVRILNSDEKARSQVSKPSHKCIAGTLCVALVTIISLPCPHEDNCNRVWTNLEVANCAKPSITNSIGEDIAFIMALPAGVPGVAVRSAARIEARIVIQRIGIILAIPIAIREISIRPLVPCG
jgi:hypothetical protein